MASWPETLPSFEQDGFTYIPEDNIIRTSVDQGPVKTRPKSTAVSTLMTGNMIMKRTEYATLVSFYTTTTVFGSIEFDFEDPVDNVTKSVKFAAPPEITATSAEWFTVSIRMEIQP
jgi:hypothetical protein